MKLSSLYNLSIKDRIDVSFSFIQIILIAFTIFYAYKAYQQSNNIFKAQSRPNLIVTENQIDSDIHLMLWNMGPGVAYDISVETHFADNIGNVGVMWIIDVIESTIELETKSDKEIFINQNTSHLGTINPPNTLPVGLEYSYKTKTFKYRPLSGLIIIIRYKDNFGDSYYSYWNGYNWYHSFGILKTPPPNFPHLHPSNPVEQFIGFFNTRKIGDYRDLDKLYSKINKEILYLEENDYIISVK